MKKKEPDLSFIREVGTLAQEDLEFYVDDNYLEIQMGNADGDSFLIILDPIEIKQLLEFLNKNYKDKI
jgi:hypothetical protein